MAVDEALLREVREPVLRLYEWSVPAVSLGYFQPAALAGDRRAPGAGRRFPGDERGRTAFGPLPVKGAAAGVVAAATVE